uniref:Carbohydrate kinase PfkB domain-containing protein n=1 Tax=Hemiselmis andersenii TaxID=464988 RepID=A0A6U4SHY2_HEMAN|mmetsp:Transcript_14546/g.35424  ORF Transcript_14546/g.35424 Transcript_14546/m.35424 type:complete len:388 (+) Transcript_14546:71-1234(+)|eukprot:CAMPEP_0169450640 /NCGR_PEP_ID=MMETSP1042-20121227/13263_1 /TAXON_ID=464988 /ORGANISM="Hemiselmis andersenii, Strain CCMP1180" /LENGTH=387 /DNA_ID=CAMNT_0009562481 /DNA_START=14 /DNA_END=1180 /DNA_ORIENTATION=+
MARSGRFHTALLLLSTLDVALAFSPSLSRLPSLAPRRAVAVSQGGGGLLTMMTGAKKAAEPPAVPDHLKGKKLLGLGIAAVDFIATVDAYPKPDDKIRSTSLSVMGGGNAANSLTACRRLGVECSLLTKLGQDDNGDLIRKELNRDGVDTTLCVTKAGLDSPFTYILVDSSTQTRTCIHTPIQEDLLPDEIPKDVLDGVSVVHLDGRNTLAAARLAEMANEAKVPVLLDIEKERPDIEKVLPLADYIITNTQYPQIFKEGASTEEGMVALLEQGRAKWVITTLGADGSQMMRRTSDDPKDQVKDPSLKYSSFEDYTVVKCAAAKPKSIVDTTGAGDSFIGAMLYGLVGGMPAEKAMLLASVVAAAKCSGPGARSALPLRSEIDKKLL